MTISSTASFSLGAVNFYADGFDCYVSEKGTTVPPMARPRLNVAGVTGANGAVATGTTWEAQEIVLACSVFADDGDVETRLDNIWAALKAHHQGNLEQLLTVGAWPTRQYYVRFSDVSDVVERNNGAEFTLTFIALNPRV